MEKRRIKRYWEYENSNAGLFCGLFGLLSIALGWYFLPGVERSEDIAAVIFMSIGIILLSCCLGWAIRYNNLRLEYEKAYPRYKK